MAVFLGPWGQFVDPPVELFDTSNIGTDGVDYDGGDHDRRISREMCEEFRSIVKLVRSADNTFSYNAITVWVLNDLYTLLHISEPPPEHFPKFKSINLPFHGMWYMELKAFLEVTEENSGRPAWWITFVHNKSQWPSWALSK